MIRVTESFATAFRDVKIIKEITDIVEEIVVDKKNGKVWFLFDTRNLPDEKKFAIMAKLMKNMKPVREFFKVYGLKKFDIEFGIIEKGDIGNEVPTSELKRANKQITDLNRIYEEVNNYITGVKEFTRKVNTLTDTVSKTSYGGLELVLSMNLYAKPEPKDEYDLSKELYNLTMIAYRELYGDFVKDYSLYNALDGRAVRVLKSTIEAKYPVNWDEVPGNTMKDKVINFIRERNLESVFFPVLKNLLKDKNILAGVEPIEDTPKPKRINARSAVIAEAKAEKPIDNDEEVGQPVEGKKLRKCSELSDDEKKQIAEAIRSGMKKKEVIERFGISERCYYTIREKMNKGVL